MSSRKLNGALQSAKHGAMIQDPEWFLVEGCCIWGVMKHHTVRSVHRVHRTEIHAWVLTEQA